MAYDPRAEYAAHLARIVRGLFDFSGRSQRMELVVYVLTVTVVWVAVSMLDSLALGGGSIRYAPYLRYALWLPALALFARRLHDQDRSGWFAAILPALIALKAWGQWRFDAGLAPVPALGLSFSAIGIALAIVFWVLALWPGTAGPNRFGPDPRNDDAATAG